MTSAWRDPIVLCGMLAGVAGLTYTVVRLDSPRIKSPMDLVTETGTLTGFSSQTTRRGSNTRFGSNIYSIHLQEFAADFQVGTDFSDAFDGSKFGTNAVDGDKVTVAFAPALQSRLHVPGARIALFGVAESSAVYLDSKASIRIYNSIQKWFSAIGFFLCCPVIICGRLKALRARRRPAGPRPSLA